MSINELKTIGVDINEAMDRFMNNEMLFKKFFKKSLCFYGFCSKVNQK